MGVLQVWNSQQHPHWHTLHWPFHGDISADPAVRLAALFGLQWLAWLGLTALWVALTLATGFFSVAPVILIGAAVGGVHLVLPGTLQRAHLPSTILATLFGGVLANVLAGLAEFSALHGISYWQVLGSRQFPGDLQVLGTAFIEAFRIQDGGYYLLALGAAVICSLRRSGQASPAGVRVQQHGP